MFTSRQIKHSRLLLRHARKYLRYKHDKLSDVDREQIVSEMQTLREALRSKDRQNIHSAAETLDKTLHKLTPVTWESHWRENCEVILVAIVIAVGIRSYFLQPFKIPTGSMQPTYRERGSCAQEPESSTSAAGITPFRGSRQITPDSPPGSKAIEPLGLQ